VTIIRTKDCVRDARVDTVPMLRGIPYSHSGNSGGLGDVMEEKVETRNLIVPPFTSLPPLLIACRPSRPHLRHDCCLQRMSVVQSMHR